MVGQEVFLRDESLKDEECIGGSLDVDDDQLKVVIEADPLITTQEIAKEFNIDHSTVMWHLKQIRKVKNLGKWVPNELTANQKNHFEVTSSLILHNKPFFNRIVTCDEKWILHNNWQ